MATTEPGGRLALITGATSGIGWETARQLTLAGWSVLLHGRGAEAATNACRSLAAQVPGARVEPVAADLASLAAVRALCDQLRQRAVTVDALVNNAGVFVASDEPATRRQSGDGYELTWAVNVLAPFALTVGLLRRQLLAPAATVVNLSSGMHLRAELAWDDLQYERHWDGRLAYAQSKLALTMLSAELAGRTAQTVVAVSPGYVDTKLVRGAFGGPALPVEVGGGHVARLVAGDPEPAASGQYVDQGRIAVPHPLVADAPARQRLWQLVGAQTGGRLPH